MLQRLIAVTVSAIVVTGCFGGKPVEKRFAEGDLYEDRKPVRAEDLSESPEEVKAIHLPSSKHEADGLRLVIQPEAAAVRAGNTITVKMAARNITGAPLSVTYASEKRFDLVVFADKNQQTAVYQWSAGRMFAQMFTEEILAGGSAVVRSLEIPTTADVQVREMTGEGLSKPLAPGTYYLWGTHEGKPYLAHGPLEITVN